MNQLKIYKTHPSVTLPKFATEQSACFDLAFCSAGREEYKGYNIYNREFTRNFSNDSMVLMPGDRILVPTGMIFDIPEGYSLRIHSRSGLSLKQGLILANCEAVIDSDYVHETMVMLTNVSDNPQTIKNGDRVAQAELVVQEKYEIVESAVAPSQKTDRVGGMGSTGVAVFAPEDVQKIEEQPVPVKRGRGRPRKVA